MSNALLHMRFTLDIPEEKLEALVGRPDDGSDDWFAESAAKAEEWARDDIRGALDYASDEPEVECVA
jgi:hypothetical protein